MENFVGLLTGVEGGSLAIALLVFAATSAAAFAAMSLVSGDRRPWGAGRRTGLADAPEAEGGRLTARLESLGAKVEADPERVAGLRARLVRAGYIDPNAVARYQVARIGLALGLPMLLLALSPLFLGGIPAGRLLLMAASVSGAGLYMPAVWLDWREKVLRGLYRDAFPDMLDLLVVCVEAGLGLDAALARVAREMAVTHPALAHNLGMVELELRAGAQRVDALSHLADRLGIDEVRSLVTLLVQSEQLGTSIAEALRVYGTEMRAHRLLRAEAKAQALPVKLAVPLSLFVFPTMMTVIMLPLVIRIVNSSF